MLFEIKAGLSACTVTAVISSLQANGLWLCLALHGMPYTCMKCIHHLLMAQYQPSHHTMAISNFYNGSPQSPAFVGSAVRTAGDPLHELPSMSHDGKSRALNTFPFCPSSLQCWHTHNVFLYGC